MKEIWKPIKNYEGLYEISNFGRVKSLKRNYYLSTPINCRGYCRVCLWRNGKAGTLMIHTAVWDHFGNAKRNGMILTVDHKDENRLNNRIDNLQLLTNRANCSKGHKKYSKSSKYTGVYWNKRSMKWRAQIQISGKDYHLGNFDDEYDAHLAYRRKLKEAGDA